MSIRDLTHEQRSVCRRAVGEDVCSEARALGALSFDPSGAEPVFLHDDLAANDARHGWLSAIFEEHEQQLAAFQSNDFRDTRWVGKELRAEAGALLRSTTELVGLVRFLGEFDKDGVAGLYWAWGVSLIRRSALCVLLCAEIDPHETVRLQSDLEELHRDLETAKFGSVARAVAHAPTDPSVTADDIFEVAIGERPTQPLNPSAPARSFPGSPSRYVELGMRQLRLIADPIAIPETHAATYLGLGCRLGSSMFPVLAHRSASLTSELIFRALATDANRVAELLVEFNVQQAGRIVTAAAKYERLLEKVMADPDTEELPKAYRTLAEGILRPHGSLIVALEHLVLGEVVAFEAFKTLGELETALVRASAPLVMLLALGMSRELRNFDAHENIVRTDTGALAAVDSAGQVHVIDIDDLYGRLLVLRSFLDGVDIAISVAFAAISVPTQEFPWDFRPTESLLQSVARLAAAQLTEGMVESLQIRGGDVNVEYRGPASAVQLGLLAAAIRRQSTALGKVEIRDAEGEVLLSDEPSL